MPCPDSIVVASSMRSAPASSSTAVSPEERGSAGSESGSTMVVKLPRPAAVVPVPVRAGSSGVTVDTAGRHVRGGGRRASGPGQFVDTVGDELRALAQFLHRPLRRVGAGDFPGRGGAGQPRGQAGGQRQFIVGHGGEAPAQRVEPEPRSARLADPPVQVLQAMKPARGTGPGGKHPRPRAFGKALPFGETAIEDRPRLPGPLW